MEPLAFPLKARNCDAVSLTICLRRKGFSKATSRETLINWGHSKKLAVIVGSAGWLNTEEDGLQSLDVSREKGLK